MASTSTSNVEAKVGDDTKRQKLHPNLVVASSAASVGLFTKLRDANTSPADFGRYSKRVTRLLAEEALAHLPSSPCDVTTPTGATFRGVASVVETDPDGVCAVSIVRAGDALLESVRECAPAVRVGKIWIHRNEGSSAKEAVWHYAKMPPGDLSEMHVLLCDPMLATGGSALSAIRHLVNERDVRPDRIVFANVVCCPEGLAALGGAFPDVKIVTMCVDDGLNDDSFIVPGLGDYGDRFFNTV